MNGVPQRLDVGGAEALGVAHSLDDLQEERVLVEHGQRERLQQVTARARAFTILVFLFLRLFLVAVVVVVVVVEAVDLGVE